MESFTTSSRPSSLRCLQPEMSRVHVLRQPESLTCGVVHHSLVVACDRHTRVVPEVSESTLETESLHSRLIPQRTAHSPTTKATPPSAFLTRISRVLHCGQASLHSLNACLRGFAAQSLSVYAMILSDRTPPSIVRPGDWSPNQKSPHSFESDHVRIFRA